MSETQQIPEMAQEAIKQLASSQGADRDQLTEQYKELVEEEKDKGVSNPEKRALRRLSLAQKGGQMSSTETLQGYVLGASDPINTSRSAINRAKSYIEKQGVDAAVKHGLIKKVPSGDLPAELASVTVKRDGEKELYAVIDSNDNSPTSGEVLPAEDWIRYVYGAVWRTPDDGPHLFSGVLNAEDHGQQPRVPPTQTPVKWDAVWVGDSDQNNTVRLRFRDTEPFEELDGFGGPDITELLEDNEFVGHVSLEEANADNYARNDVVVTYGSVTYMELAPDEGQSRRLSVVDPFAFGSDLSRTVWLSDHVDVNFAEESDIYVVGQVSKSQNEYPDSIEALGVYVHPDYRVERQNVESMSDDEPSESEEREPEPDPEPPAETGVHAEADDDGDDTEAESEHDADFETGATIDESEQAEKAEEGEHLPDAVKEAGYDDLRAVAADVDEVPGSGIGTEEMRDQLVDALGAATLAERLADDGGDEAEAGAEAVPDDDAEETASADGGESVVSDEDKGDFEPSEADDSWNW